MARSAEPKPVAKTSSTVAETAEKPARKRTPRKRMPTDDANRWRRSQRAADKLLRNEPRSVIFVPPPQTSRLVVCKTHAPDALIEALGRERFDEIVREITNALNGTQKKTEEKEETVESNDTENANEALIENFLNSK